MDLLLSALLQQQVDNEVESNCSNHLCEENPSFEAINIDNTLPLSQLQSTQIQDETANDARNISFTHSFWRNEALANNCEISSCIHMKQLCDIMYKYNQFIHNKLTIEEKSEHGTSLNAFEDIHHNNVAVLNNFHHLLKIHDHEFETIYNVFRNSNNTNPCVLSQCFMMRRNHRDRCALSTNDKDMKRLYFNTDEVSDISTQQILDKIHCYYLHSLDIGYKISANDWTNIEQATHEWKETDTQNEDINDNIVHKLNQYINIKQNACESVKGLCDDSGNNKFSTNPDAEQSIAYSFGFRYFYWDYFKNNNNISDPTRYLNQSTATAANEGHTLDHFYISAKFKDLKDELINNPVHGSAISANQWNVFVTKATSHLQTEHMKLKQVQGFLFGNDTDSKVFYDIDANSPMTPDHVIGIMLYCNQTMLQQKLSETYRKMSANEDIESVINRHRNFAHLGRILRECVDLFSSSNESFAENLKRRLFHGISIKTGFESMNACIKGPTSTTTEYAVAVNFCTNTGMILEMEMDITWRIGMNAYVASFDCEAISDYPYEKEVFFIGGYSYFLFRTITTPQGQNYQYYVSALSVISEYFKPLYAPRGTAFDERLKIVCYRIISHQLHACFPDDDKYHAFKSMPEYAQLLVSAHFLSTKRVWISVHDEGDDELDAYMNSIMNEFCSTLQLDEDYMELLMKEILYDDIGWIQLDVLTNLFPNIQSIVFNRKAKSDDFAKNESIYLSVLSLILNNKSMKLKDIQIEITSAKVIESMKQNIVAKYKNEFAKLHWIFYVDTNDVAITNIVMQNKQVNSGI